ncbi:hypothetical protein C8J57DRAFT_1521539 [Mycena rebaudengoi]|nr:hypothetical protein C8J57DRAFT_1521539 [Mycena rebaudengoi]
MAGVPLSLMVARRLTWLWEWYSADWDYGQTTLIFFCTAIAFAVIVNRVAWIRAGSSYVPPSYSSPSKRPGSATSVEKAPATPRFLDRTAATFRFTVTRLPANSICLKSTVGGMFFFTIALMLAVRRFYWPNDAMGHSPPIATRAGWITIAIMPLMIASGTKVNFVGMFTGTSHKKLQVFHRWSAVLMYIMSLVHTFPFIINDIRMGSMEASYATSPWYWTGVAALIPQTYLVSLSWGIFHGPYYETFKLHFMCCLRNLYGRSIYPCQLPPNFLVRSAKIPHSLSALTSILGTISGQLLPYTASHDLGDSTLNVSIRVPSRFKWTPGQHVFMRFLGLGIHALSSHPFSVSSLHTGGEENTVELVLRVHGGITRVLARKVSGRPLWATRVVVDGPHSGLHVPLQTYDRVLLFAGGSGATFTLPLLLDLVRNFNAGGPGCRHIEFVVAVRNRDTYGWIEPTVAAASAVIPDPVHLSVRVHFTGTDSNEKNDPDTATDERHFERGRPRLAELVREAHDSSRRVAIVACGPDSFLYDVRNAVAQCELVNLDGFGLSRDMFLHTEPYTAESPFKW